MAKKDKKPMPFKKGDKKPDDKKPAPGHYPKKKK